MNLEILSISDYIRYAVYTEDHATYLWDHIGIRCLCWLNPDATSKDKFLNEGNALGAVGDALIGGGRLIGGSPASPVVTEIEMVARLKEPRRKLIVWMDSSLADDEDPAEIVLESPLPRAVCDAQFGPQCTVHGLYTYHGNASLVADIQFETDINDCKDKGALLSNRWTYGVQYDPKNYAVSYVIDGEAIFRMDELLRLKMSPDLARPFLVPTCPNGFQREAPVFELHSGGAALKYTIVDRQTPMSFPVGSGAGAAHIEMTERRVYAREVFDAEMAGFVGGFLGGGAASEAAKRRFVSPIGEALREAKEKHERERKAEGK